MNNRQRQLLFVFLASMGLGLLAGLAYTFTSQMIRPAKIDLDPALPDQNRRPEPMGPPPPEQTPGPAEADCAVPPGGGPPVTQDFQPC
ncbi:hypothetical protein KR52_08960 [Synechococcus sp. KORDI-52]|uniref:hypothetical protein n=1 Tax=Synechococcus sp. KORDI-52 TaxID=585425 RepID=UPI0004E09FF8|nr:hypothetical protein [Synechococcus sp. KORDI-52]AII49272.1 hypothetical protein KR52_08960 [Synechococcus sp. KORDI-52]